MNTIQTNKLDYIDEIIDLYIHAFSTGISQQYVDRHQIKNYLSDIITHGYALLSFENNILVAALIACPMSFPVEHPHEILEKYPLESSFYIAEIMVLEAYRGKGIGRKLINQCLKNSGSHYTDIFIRVWDKNEAALALYERMGFDYISTFHQEKRHPDGNGIFKMNKLYLHQTLKAVK